MQIFLIIIGALLILDTIIVRLFSNFNLGVILPAILGAPLLVYGIFKTPLDVWMLGGFGCVLKWIAIFCYVAFTVCFVLTVVCTSVSAEKNKAEPGADAVIVLGAAVRKGLPTRVLMYRLDAAYEYRLENPDTVIVVSGGQGHDEPESEAAVMKRYLINKGMAEDAIIMEDASRNSRENFLYSKKILEEKFQEGYRAAYVTNRFHILRSGMAAKSVGMDVSSICARSTWYVAFNNYLRETCALAKYVVFGAG